MSTKGIYFLKNFDIILYKNVAICEKIYYNIIEKKIIWSGYRQKGDNMIKNKKILTGIITMFLVLSLTACNKSDSDSSSESSSSISSDISSTSDNNEITPPEGYVDNSSVNESGYTHDEIYMNVGGVDNIAVKDEQIFDNGNGFQYRFSTNLLTTDKSNSESAPCITDMKNDIDKFIIGDKEYKYEDLIRDQSQGIEIVKMFAEDFGLNLCDNSGNLIEHKGNVSDIDMLRNLYSDKVEYDSYTACAYYFDVKMNNLNSETYDKYRIKYKEANNTDTGAYLDGVLGVVLYYDLDGHDYFYSIVLSAPTYYSNEKNFEANMMTNVRKDITNCCAQLKNGLKIGFVNKTAIMCSETPAD